MFDRRVIRGNTYAAQAMPVAPPEELKPKRAPRRKPPGTPDPVEGRRHMDIQTEAYLEELADDHDVKAHVELGADAAIRLHLDDQVLQMRIEVLPQVVPRQGSL